MSINMDRNVYHKELILKAEKAVTELKGKALKDPHRLNYHFMAPASWINDPNGLIYFKGEYHMFYQQHPYSASNGPKHWGHAKSKDHVHWEHMPIALAPSEDYEKNGCFSGTAVDDNGTFTLIYTGNVHGGPGKKKQVQCIATSEDGVTFTKFAGNPVIEDFPEEGSIDFRDPKVWMYTDSWYMAIGSGKDGKANALLYKSKDLLSWDYIGKMTESKSEDQGKIWNCPDFFTVGGKDVLLVSPAVSPNYKDNRKTIYIIGKMDYETGVFTQEFDEDIDYGFDFYAPQTLIDEQGRVILIGWLDMWWNPMPTQEYGWAGAMTIPRVVSLLPDGKLCFSPLPELQALREKHQQFKQIHLKQSCPHILGDIQGDSLEIIAEYDLNSCNAEEFGFKLRCSVDGKQQTLITYNKVHQELSVDRTKSGIVESGISKCKLEATSSNTLELHIFLDRSSVEVFGNGGRVAMSHRIYPDPSSLGVEMLALGGSVKVTSVDIWNLKSIW
jgi:beta-fructofuranosidase